METIGGQAVIEGVMIKSKKWTVTAVRKSNGKIVFKKKRNNSLTNKQLFGLPFLRGIITLGETLAEGYRALEYSAKQADETGGNKKVGKAYTLVSFAIAMVLALVIFKLIPLGVTQLLAKSLGLLQGRIFFNLTEGAIKAAIFVGYIYIISFFKDIRRVFQYHGAEHKAVNCYENGKGLSLKKAKKYPTLHPRCGTAFLLSVLVISVIVYTFLPIEMGFFWKYSWRVMLLPAIGGISYELIKLSSRHRDNILLKAISWPGMALQKMTTREPDSKQLEVALFAAKKALE